MLVRLAFSWTDLFGVRHHPGELVDIDAVTLAELEEQGVVENLNETPDKAWIGPGAPEPDAPVPPPTSSAWIGPGSPPPDTDPKAPVPPLPDVP
jgi:hypothetical protein